MTSWELLIVTSVSVMFSPSFVDNKKISATYSDVLMLNKIIMKKATTCRC